MGLLKIEFEAHEEQYQKLLDIFNAMGEEALYYTHHDLAAATDITVSDWREFLLEPRVQEQLQIELNLMQQAAIMKMTKDIDKSKSTGQAQLMNTLINQSNNNKVKEGPIFIYNYIPLNQEEVHAPDVHVVEGDPFKVDV